MTFPAFNPTQALQLAHQTFDIEAQALLGLKQQIGPAFADVVEKILHTRGRVVVTGMGKAGHVGRKIAATLASTGTPAMFVHPAEASHGDLGMIKAIDLVLAISNSGESDEINAILPTLIRLGVPLVAITGGIHSSLAKHAHFVLNTAVPREACPLNLAPTASTTAQMAMGDALAVALLDARGFKENDFAVSHPGGALGRRLLTHVSDVMRPIQDTPKVLASATLAQVMKEMSAKGLGASAVISPENKVLGIFTDGDLRRLIESGQELLSLSAEKIMKPAPQTIYASALAVEAAQLMEEFRINSILVVNAHQELVGSLNTHDLLRAKVI